MRNPIRYHIGQIFTADDLMTPASQLLTWKKELELLENKVTQAKAFGFDILPIEERGKITGVFSCKAQETHALSSEWLVSRDTGIPDLLELFTKTTLPVLLVFFKQEVIGLVAPADLNKLQARVYLYNLIGELELALMQYVLMNFSGGESELIDLLSKERAIKIRENLKELEEGNTRTNVFSLLYLSDLLTIIEKTKVLRLGLGFSSRGQAEGGFSGLNDLRISIMHLVKPVLQNAKVDIPKLWERVNKAEAMIIKLSTKIQPNKE